MKRLQVRELLERRPLDFYMQPSRHAEPPRVHFCKYEELFVPEVQAYLWIKRKQVTRTNTHTPTHVPRKASLLQAPHLTQTAQPACKPSHRHVPLCYCHMEQSVGSVRCWLPLLPLHVTQLLTSTAAYLSRVFLSLYHRWRRIVHARRTMRDFIKRSQLEWDYWSKYIYFRHWKLFLTQTHFMHVPATEIQRIWKGIGPRRVGC